VNDRSALKNYIHKLTSLQNSLKEFAVSFAHAESAANT
jgi:hypothetical protein